MVLKLFEKKINKLDFMGVNAKVMGNLNILMNNITFRT